MDGASQLLMSMILRAAINCVAQTVEIKSPIEDVK